jgi:16S rRNA (uracil1498-N3)-methyltransferase
MYRFFVSHESFSGETVQVTERTLVHHLRDVLRLHPGDTAILLDNTGWEYETVLHEVEMKQVTGQILQRRLCPHEPRTKITLYQAVLKGERFEWALQKGTEIGVSAFVPVLSERCVVLNATELSPRKLGRWEKIIQAAAEQSRRGRMPPLLPAMLFVVACEQVQRAGTVAFIPWEEGGMPIRQALEEAGRDRPPFNVALFIGPEGGFAPTEVQLARDYGILPVSLGPRILRAETAGVVAAAVVLYQYGDLQV